MAVYTYDADADALYVLLVEEPEAAIERTEELGPTLHVDVDARGTVIGVEILYPRTHGVDLTPVKERYGLDIEIPFRFAA
jgi:uncharacterized protein YuzE